MFNSQMGLDPSTNVLGFAIIEADKKAIKVIEIGVLTFAHISSDDQAQAGQGPGVAAIAAGMVNHLAITEYMFKKIKNAVTGNDNASKEQVVGMLEKILHTKFSEKHFDATDAGEVREGEIGYPHWKAIRG